MNKGKFASLIMLGVFSAGVASSSAVSARAQGDGNLASVVDNKGASSHDDSVTTDFKFSDELVSVSDENNIYLKQQTDEETKNAITDENNDARDDTENLDKDINDKADSPEDSDKENSKNKDYVYINKEQNVKKSKGVGMAEGLAVAGGGASAVGIAAFGINKLVKSSGNEKKYEPIPEINPKSHKPTDSKEEEKEPEKKEEKNPSEKPKEEEKGGFGEWYKNNLIVSIPLTIYISWIIAYMVVAEIVQQIYMRKNGANGIYLEFASEKNDGGIKPLGIFKNFTNKDRFEMDENYPERTIIYSGLERIGINALAAVTLSYYVYWFPLSRSNS